MRVARGSFGLLVLLAGAAHCSLLVDADISELRCSQEGMIGAPACDPGQVCGSGRCHACIAREVCNDGVDNDCDGRVDEHCQGETGGGAGGQGAADSVGEGGTTAAAGSGPGSN